MATSIEHLMMAESSAEAAEAHAVGGATQESVSLSWNAIMHALIVLARLRYAASEKTDPAVPQGML